jgi:hypothetical protein
MKTLAVIAAALLLGRSACAAGIDSRTYACSALQSLIAARGFVFLSQATFGDFVVANISYCSGGALGGSIVELRSVATSDNPECLVNYCGRRGSASGGNGGN